MPFHLPSFSLQTVVVVQVLMWMCGVCYCLVKKFEFVDERTVDEMSVTKMTVDKMICCRITLKMFKTILVTSISVTKIRKRERKEEREIDKRK
jgi:hypothetical protein